MADFGIYGIIPPLLAIAFAMATRKVFQSLLLGIFAAGIMVAGADAVAGDASGWLVPFAAVAGGFMNMVTWVVGGIAGVDWDGSADSFYIGHAAVVAFTVFLGGLVALMQRSGGVKGFGDMFLNMGAGRRGGMLFASLGGIFLAIDDYFHVIAAGSIFRPVTDDFKISREKLSYLIDSTAAPAVILVPISTWAGIILGSISGVVDGQNMVDAAGAPLSSFNLLVGAIPFNFYAILTIAFVVFIAGTGADWGPMAKAERRALTTGKLHRDDATLLMSEELEAIEPSISPKARNLILPVIFLIVSTLAMLISMGWDAANGVDTPIKALQQTPMPELSLAISSFLTLLFAMSLYAFQGMKQDDFTDRFLDGAKAMTPAIAILALAWGIGNAVSAIGLGDWIATAVADDLSPGVVPLIAFVLASVIAFATGTSFGTFAIMIPISLPVAYATGGAEWIPAALAASIGGAVFGDHCSPISDTTVMSSMAAQSDHIDHVRTQLPYALSIAGVAIGGYAALALSGFGLIAWITNIILFALLALMTLFLWRRGNGSVAA